MNRADDEWPTSDDADEVLRRDRSVNVRKQLPEVCEELVGLCSMSYTYGLRSLVSEFKVTEPRHAMTILNASDRLASSYARVLKLLDKHDVKLHETEDWEVVLNPMFDLLTQVTRLVLEPLVESARRQGSVTPATFDRYADFRGRWNELIRRLQGLAKLTGFTRDLSSMWFAPELGVQART